jgi:hypothetical protein
LCAAAAEEPCAASILNTLLRRAYRRPATPADLQELLPFYRQGRAQAGFDNGIASAVAAVLANPKFLFRVETDSPKAASTASPTSNSPPASRSSSGAASPTTNSSASPPGKLSQPAELERQTRRLLADPRSKNLATNFAGQWLRLRNIDSVIPSGNLFRDFDDNLRQAFRQETELLLRRASSAKIAPSGTFLKSDYTFLNERLARHYDIPGIYGSRFRRVALPPGSHRGGLLRHGSILSVTSYATRTSPSSAASSCSKTSSAPRPPPRPPPSLPSRKPPWLPTSPCASASPPTAPTPPAPAATAPSTPSASPSKTTTPPAAGAPVEVEDQPVDAAGAIPGDRAFQGVDGLEDALLRHPELFAATLTENLLTFALGRGVEYYDAPAVRKIVATAEKNDYRFSSIILGVVNGAPFRLRRAEPLATAQK